MSRVSARSAFVVKCDDWTTKPAKTREDAERVLASIEHAGHCANTHEIVAMAIGCEMPSGDAFIDRYFDPGLISNA
jgi:hypothetical protein